MGNLRNAESGNDEWGARRSGKVRPGPDPPGEVQADQARALVPARPGPRAAAREAGTAV